MQVDMAQRSGPGPEAERVGKILQERNMTMAVAESLTGGMLAGEFAKAGGASDWFRGGVVAYSSEVKHQLLGVPPGPVVSREAAEAMAAGAAARLGASVAVAVTGVGGPDGQDGQPPGTVWVATWPESLGPPEVWHLDGEPEDICEQTCARAVGLLAERLERR